MNCNDCGSDNTEIFPAETFDERDVLHCYDCGTDEKL